MRININVQVSVLLGHFLNGVVDEEWFWFLEAVGAEVFHDGKKLRDEVAQFVVVAFEFEFEAVVFEDLYVPSDVGECGLVADDLCHFFDEDVDKNGFLSLLVDRVYQARNIKYEIDNGSWHLENMILHKPKLV